MTNDDLRAGLDAGVGRLQDGLDTVFGFTWLRGRACRFLCAARNALSDMIVDRPILSMALGVLGGLLLGSRLDARR